MWTPPSWTEQASCLGLYEDYDQGRPTRALLAVCGSCPVRVQCDEEQMREELGAPLSDRATLRAGKVPSKRVLAERHSPTCPGCGAHGGPCDPCKARAKQARQLDMSVQPLRCIQCGETLPKYGAGLRCNDCADHTGRWGKE